MFIYLKQKSRMNVITKEGHIRMDNSDKRRNSCFLNYEKEKKKKSIK